MKKTIYKKDSKGKIRFLTIQTDDDVLKQISGVLDTENPVEHSKICKGKNIGRTNETTPHGQALSEGQSVLIKKLREGYFETIEEAEEKGGEDFLAPMLAKDGKPFLKKLKFPCYVQPKLDGIRCINTKEGKKLSRKNVEITTMHHIDVFNNIIDFDKDREISYVTDGELYVHGKTFQENTRLIKKYRPGESEEVKYHIYDIIIDEPFSVRTKIAKQIALHSNNCEVVPTFVVNSVEDIKRYHAQFLSEGYEGTIIRWSEQGYQVNKRTLYLLKYKDFLDEAYEVVDIIPNEAKPEQGTVVCVNFKGDIFKTGMKFSHAERIDMLTYKHKYIGQMAEIRFFEFTEDGIPRFPVCVGFRIDK